jgi:hypothetical protein
MHSPTQVTGHQVHVLLNSGSNIKTNIIMALFPIKSMQKKKDFKYK